MNTHKKYRIVPLLVLGVGLTVLAFQHLSSNVAAQVLRHNEPETGRVLPGCNIHNSKRRLPLHSLPDRQVQVFPPQNHVRGRGQDRM